MKKQKFPDATTQNLIHNFQVNHQSNGIGCLSIIK